MVAKVITESDKEPDIKKGRGSKEPIPTPRSGNENNTTASRNTSKQKPQVPPRPPHILQEDSYSAELPDVKSKTVKFSGEVTETRIVEGSQGVKKTVKENFKLDKDIELRVILAKDKTPAQSALVLDFDGTIIKKHLSNHITSQANRLGKIHKLLDKLSKIAELKIAIKGLEKENYRNEANLVKELDKFTAKKEANEDVSQEIDGLEAKVQEHCFHYLNDEITTEEIQDFLQKKGGFRNKDELKESIEKALNNGIAVAVASHSCSPVGTKLAMEELLGKKLADKITVVTCDDNDMRRFFIKEPLLKTIQGIYKIKDQGKITLVDDRKENVVNIEAAGYQGIHAPVSKENTSYLTSIDSFVTQQVKDGKGEPIYVNIDSVTKQIEDGKDGPVYAVVQKKGKSSDSSSINREVSDSSAENDSVAPKVPKKNKDLQNNIDTKQKEPSKANSSSAQTATDVPLKGILNKSTESSGAKTANRVKFASEVKVKDFMEYRKQLTKLEKKEKEFKDTEEYFKALQKTEEGYSATEKVYLQKKEELSKLEEELSKLEEEFPELGEEYTQPLEIKPRENPIITAILIPFRWVRDQLSNLANRLLNRDQTPGEDKNLQEEISNQGLKPNDPEQGKDLAQNKKTVDQISLTVNSQVVNKQGGIDDTAKGAMKSALKQSVLDKADELGLKPSSEKGKLIIKFDSPITEEQGKQLLATAKENTDILSKYVASLDYPEGKDKEHFTKAIKNINAYASENNVSMTVAVDEANKVTNNEDREVEGLAEVKKIAEGLADSVEDPIYINQPRSSQESFAEKHANQGKGLATTGPER